MSQAALDNAGPQRLSWWHSIGPALVTACVVFGPGSLVVNSNVGATYGYDFLWLLALIGVFMGVYMTMGARIGVVGGATPCTLLATQLGRWAAVVVGINLCLICAAFQFANNMAVALALRALVPGVDAPVALMVVNGLVIVFLFTAKNVYRVLERVMKVMVGVILLCFLFNLVIKTPPLMDVLHGFVPGLPAGLSLRLPARVGTEIRDPLLLVASLLGTTLSVGAAFFQGNLVREKRWTSADYDRGVGDAIAGVSVLTGVSAIIMITGATVIPGQPAADIGQLAKTLLPLLGTTSYLVFCAGLMAVAMNPFLINAMIGGSILADALGLPAGLSDRWPRIFTIAVLLAGMAVGLVALRSGAAPVGLIILGQALTVIGNPLMAAAMLYLANRADVMGTRRNSAITNSVAGIGLLVVVLGAIHVLSLVFLKLS
ncbi:MAG: hypothetical protein A2W31_16845 [Planctomycetes bacterium RBG_16_64_10]|nr:MAG: hypothetical protein A2W31_16845 [Planctomycetes bacterium RBG_16_64_10]